MDYEEIDKVLKAFYESSKQNKNQSEDDKIFRSSVTSEITNRDEEYTKLLVHFVSITKIRNVLKEVFKWVFYFAIIISIVVFIILVCKIFNKLIVKATVEQLIESIPLFITSIVGLVSVIIAIPIAVTKYLFSTKEDENITKIILHTQEHDTTGRQWTLDSKSVIMDDNKSDSNSENDDKSQIQGWEM